MLNQLSCSWIARASVCVTVAVSLAAPGPVLAATRVRYDLYNPRKTYKDEKVTIKNPTSRCNTASMRAAHEKNVARAERDIGKIDVSASSTKPESKAARTYLKGLTVLWDAMEEPYCGFGAFGVTAAKRSYDKNVNRLRTTFLNDMKKLKAKTAAKK